MRTVRPCPYDLLVVKEADAQHPVHDIPREFRRVPDVGDLDARRERKCIAPIRAGVAGDGRLGMADGAPFHIPRLSQPAAVQPGTVTPFQVQFDYDLVLRGVIWRVLGRRHDHYLPPGSAKTYNCAP